MDFNLPAVFFAAIIPSLIGFLWYSPLVFGKQWMDASGLTIERLKGGSILLQIGFSLFLSFMLSFFLQYITIHQLSVFSLLENQPGMYSNPVTNQDYLNIINKYSTNFRTFKHGLLHGTTASLFFILPVLGITSIFERKSLKYLLVHLGYWTLTLALMGGILSAWMKS